MTSGVLHVRLTRAHVRKTAAARAAAVLPVVYAAYTVHFRRSTRLSSRVSHVTFPTVVTVSIVRGSILFVLYELLVIYMYETSYNLLPLIAKKIDLAQVDVATQNFLIIF